MTSDLIARLEAATERDARDWLDRDLAIAIGWKVDQQDVQGRELWLAPGESHTRYLPKFTTSIDAKLPDEYITCVVFLEGKGWSAFHTGKHGCNGSAIATTEPLARRAACLRARQSET